MTSQAGHHGGGHGGGGWMGCDGVGWVGRASWSWLSAGVVQRCRTAVQGSAETPRGMGVEQLQGPGHTAAPGRPRPQRVGGDRAVTAPRRRPAPRPGRPLACSRRPRWQAGQRWVPGRRRRRATAGRRTARPGRIGWDRPANRADPVMTAHPARRNLQAEHGLHNVLQAPSSRQRQEGERAHVRGNRHEADGDRRWRQGRGTAAATLRDEGFDGPVVLISREPEIPFGRPRALQDLPAIRRGARRLVRQAGRLVRGQRRRAPHRFRGRGRPAAHQLALGSGRDLEYGSS